MPICAMEMGILATAPNSMLELLPKAWTELVREFGRMFHCVAGHPENTVSIALITSAVFQHRPKHTLQQVAEHRSTT